MMCPECDKEVEGLGDGHFYCPYCNWNTEDECDGSCSL